MVAASSTIAFDSLVYMSTQEESDSEGERTIVLNCGEGSSRVKTESVLWISYILKDIDLDES